MTPSETDANPNKKPQIGRREIGAFLPLLLALNWTFVPTAEPATLVAH